MLLLLRLRSTWIIIERSWEWRRGIYQRLSRLALLSAPSSLCLRSQSDWAGPESERALLALIKLVKGSNSSYKPGMKAPLMNHNAVATLVITSMGIKIKDYFKRKKKTHRRFTYRNRNHMTFGLKKLCILNMPLHLLTHCWMLLVVSGLWENR